MAQHDHLHFILYFSPDLHLLIYPSHFPSESIYTFPFYDRAVWWTHGVYSSVWLFFHCSGSTRSGWQTCEYSRVCVCVCLENRFWILTLLDIYLLNLSFQGSMHIFEWHLAFKWFVILDEPCNWSCLKVDAAFIWLHTLIITYFYCS